MHGDKKHLERITGFEKSVQFATEQVSAVLRSCSVSGDEGIIRMAIGNYACALLRHEVCETYPVRTSREFPWGFRWMFLAFHPESKST